DETRLTSLGSAQLTQHRASVDTAPDERQYADSEQHCCSCSRQRPKLRQSRQCTAHWGRAVIAVTFWAPKNTALTYDPPDREISPRMARQSYQETLGFLWGARGGRCGCDSKCGTFRSRYAAASCSQYWSQSPLARTTRSESMGCTLSAFHHAPGNLRRC